MSHQPSPGPSNSHQHNQSAGISSRQKSNLFATGIAAGAEDVKYQAKYAELKRKVKEIESDNDKLHFKVLQAKRSIQRMKLERAVLYERLSAVPPSPDRHDQLPLPPYQTNPDIPPSRPIPPNPTGNYPQRETHGREQYFQSLNDHMHTHNNARIVAGPDGRPMSIPDASVGPGIAPPFQGKATRQSKYSLGGHDISRQLPPLPHVSALHSYDQSRILSDNPHHHPRQGSSHLQAFLAPSNERSRSRPHQMTPNYHPEYSHAQPYPGDALPSGMRSPGVSGEREQERGRHQELHDPHESSTRVQISSHSKSAQPLHGHGRVQGLSRSQRLGRYTQNDAEHEREREQEHWDRGLDRDRGRDYARGNEQSLSSARTHTPPPSRHSRMPERVDYQDRAASSAREEPASSFVIVSRDVSPGSGSGTGSGYGPSERAQYGERDRGYTSRNANRAGGDEFAFTHGDGRPPQPSCDHKGGSGGAAYAAEHTRPSLDSRKRARHETEVDEEHDVGGLAGGGRGMVHADDRRSLRYHREPSPSSQDADRGLDG